jgi:exodeoxyribonuclease VII small subunit
MKKENVESKDFEKSLKKLEQIVQSLESGELSLEEGIKSFEEGVVLYKDCKKVLSSAEKKIKVLTDDLSEIDF